MKACRVLICMLVLSVVLAGCGGVGGTANDIAKPAPMVRGQVSQTNNPQVALYTISSPSDAAVTVKFGKDTNYGLHTWAQKTPPGGGSVSILVAGMQATTTYHMQADVEFANGTKAVDADHTFTTGDVPANLPSLTVTTTAGMTPQPGVELIDDVFGGTPTAAFVTDLSGNVIWAYAVPDGQTGSTLYPIKQLPNGDFVLLTAPQSQSALQSPVSDGTLNVIREIDLTGKTIKELRMSDLNARLAAGFNNLKLQAFHHDITPLPNGHWLVLANTLKQFTGLAGLPGTTNVLGDVVVDLDPNLQPVWVWNSFDQLDVNRHPYNFPDWTHANAVVYSPDDGNILVSLRHQNWIVKIDYRDGTGTGNVLWKLGPGGDFKLQGGTDPTDWFYAQHDPEFFSQNTTGVFSLGIMDNGDDRILQNNLQCGTSGAPACYTTVQVLQVDDHGMTANLQFHRIMPPDLYSFFGGNVDLLKNGNVEYNLAAVGPDAYVVEVTQESSPQTVWQMHIFGTNTYRALRLSSLYPGVQW